MAKQHDLKRVGKSLNSFIIKEIVATLREGTGPLEVVLRNGQKLTFSNETEIALIREILFPEIDVPPVGDWSGKDS